MGWSLLGTLCIATLKFEPHGFGDGKAFLAEDLFRRHCRHAGRIEQSLSESETPTKIFQYGGTGPVAD